MKAVLIAIVAVVILSSGCTGQQNSPIKENTLPTITGFSFTTDSGTYHSGEFMEMVVTIDSDGDIDRALLKVWGVPDNYDITRISNISYVSITAPEKTVHLLMRMPECYGCAGVSEGNYTITAEISVGDFNETFAKNVTLVR